MNPLDMTDEQTRQMFQLSRDSWRVFRIVSEFVEGFEKMTSIGPSVTIFGSARFKPENPYYQLAIQVAKEIASRNFAIITGGGPGIMEAANHGAKLAGKPSCGLAIDLPFENDANAFVDREWRLRFRYFFVRKVMFMRYAKAFVVLPGGMGTFDELFEALTLMQTQKIRNFPIILMGSSYWQGLVDWLRKTPMEHGCIQEKDIERMIICDDPVEVANIIEKEVSHPQDQPNF